MTYEERFRGLADAARMLRVMMEAREAAAKTARFRPDGKYKPRISRNREIADRALLREPIPGGGGAEWWIAYGGMRENILELRKSPILPLVERTLDPEALNGYVAFPKRHAPKLPTNSYGGILQYIPVHGGVTYAVKDSYMAVWGFDTLHCDSGEVPRADRAWILGQCRLLHTGLLIAAKLWPEWRKASQARRTEMADWMLQLVDDGRVGLTGRLNLGSMLDLMRGRIGE
ncbi:MAG TPA: hypothetical protein VE030_11160 [Burkholderiales bacterium]|nr:hypothetical protein [Burkholderiales bacterium]